MKKLYFLLVSLLIVNLTHAQWTQIGQDIDGEAGADFYGWSVDLNADGTVVAIGGPNNDGNGIDAGHVRVFEYNGGSWIQLGSDIDAENAEDSFGRSVCLSSNGSIVAIGANLNDGNGSAAGHVRVYEYIGGNWVQMGNDIDGEAAGDFSGGSVSLSSDGSILAIGALWNADNGMKAGHTRIFEYNGGNWIQLGNDIDGEAAMDYSGGSVSLSSDGTVVAIGAIKNVGNGFDSGHTRVYEYNGNNWLQVGNDIDGEAADDNSGGSVSLSSDGSIVAIGARDNDGNGSNAGHVRVYENIGGNWVQMGVDIDGEAADDLSGYSVSLSSDGSIVAIGARDNDGNSSDAGHVRVYEYIGGNWVQIGSDIDGEAIMDWSGASVSLSSDGSIVAIGAIRGDANGGQSGHARIFNSTCNTFYTINSTECNSYTSPSGIYTWNTSGIYLDTILNSFGCDSIITIELDIISIDTTVNISGLSILSNDTGIATYQWLKCDNNFQVISGETNQYFSPAQNGEYAVEITKNQCVDTSECIIFDLIGIDELNETIRIYPNPTSSYICLYVPQLMVGETIQICDQVGRNIFQNRINKRELCLDVSTLQSGLYFIQIVGNRVYSNKVIKL